MLTKEGRIGSTVSLLLALRARRLVSLIDVDGPPAVAFCGCFPDFNQSSLTLVIIFMTSTTPRVSFLCRRIRINRSSIPGVGRLGLETFARLCQSSSSNIPCCCLGILQRVTSQLDRLNNVSGEHRLSTYPKCAIGLLSRKPA